jgi:two-component system phosphate regulon sensor histidine kinase PhoR
MKKIILLSIVLVAISLVGFIVLQVVSIRSFFDLQKQQFYFRVEQASIDVAAALAPTTTSSATTLRTPRIPTLTFNSSDLDDIVLVKQRFTVDEVNDKLREALAKHGAKNIHTEFEIRVGPDTDPRWEMRSKNYAEADAADTEQRRPNYSISPRETPSKNQESIVTIIPNVNKQVWKSLTWILVGLALFTLVVIAAFYLTLRTMLEQRRLSKIKSDFINNMTHELKTPIATISLAIDALHNPKVQADTEKRKYFGGIIKEENKRMNKHVETILQAAFMEKQELKFSNHPLHVHEVVKNVVGNFDLQLQEKQGQVTQKLNATNDLIDGDDIHFTNLINNLVDNAIKYAQPKRPLRITITSRTYGKNFILQVQDNGIGMSKETAKRIFEKFYRAHTGNLHNVKGFGLGMSYVKTVIDAHKGKIKVDSILGKGSTFTIEIPLSKEPLNKT